MTPPDLQTPETGVRSTIRANETGLLTPDLLGEEIAPQVWSRWSPQNARPLGTKACGTRLQLVTVVTFRCRQDLQAAAREIGFSEVQRHSTFVL
jgi:hypothetical protein